MKSGLWLQLPAELQARVANFLPRNDVPCTLRLVNKATRNHFNGPQHTTVHLSEPVRHEEFVWRWGPKSTHWRTLNRATRTKLICLVAATGDIANLKLALRSSGIHVCDCALSEVMEAAAAAGQLYICQMLVQHGLKWVFALRGGAKAGRRDISEWAAAHCTLWNLVDGANIAAQGGHPALTEWFLDRLWEWYGVVLNEELYGRILRCVAESCDLATLERLHRAFLPSAADQDGPDQGQQQQQQPQQQRQGPVLAPIPELALWHNGDPQGHQPQQPQQQGAGAWRELVIACAARSPTPDWQAKLEWLEVKGYPKCRKCCEAAAPLPDAVDRLTWLRARGYPLDEVSVARAAGAGNLAALEYLLEEVGVKVTDCIPCEEAAMGGQLAALQLLHARGCRLNENCIYGAAWRGHLAVLEWQVAVLEVDVAQLQTELMENAAELGSVEVLRWLAERGAAMDAGTWIAAARGGCEAALEWLAEVDCPMQVTEYRSPLCTALFQYDMATMRALRRLGCFWTGTYFFVQSVGLGYPLEFLRWLVEEGCPVDWGRALDAVWRRQVGDREEVTAWLRDEARAVGLVTAGSNSGSEGGSGSDSAHERDGGVGVGGVGGFARVSDSGEEGGSDGGRDSGDDDEGGHGSDAASG